MKKETDWFLKLLIWREKNIKEKNFILILSFVVGILAALAAYVLKFLIIIRGYLPYIYYFSYQFHFC